MGTILSLVQKGVQLFSHFKWPREKVLEYSDRLFRRTVKLAYEKSEFYHEFYRSHGLKADDLEHVSPSDIPGITKDLVRSNFYRIATRKIDPDDVNRALDKGDLIPRVGGCVLVHSSGSTGKPCNFLYGEDAMTAVEANMARISLRGAHPVGLRDFPIQVLYVASVGSGYSSTAIALSALEKYRARSVVLRIQDPWQDWVDKLQGFKPNVVAGYPSCLRLVADLQAKGRIDLRPKKVIAGGEPVTRETMSYFNDAFGADIIDYYSCTETIVLGAGFDDCPGMYLFDDFNYVEVDGSGHLIFTPLYNDVFPLIRYRLTDVVEGFSKEETGPLPFTHVDRIIGRDEELMWFRGPGGRWDFLHPLFLDDLDVEGIEVYQFVQTGEAAFTLRTVLKPGVSSNLEGQIRSQIDGFLARKGLSNVTYDVEFVESLPLDLRTGKVRLVEKDVAVTPTA